MEDGEAAVNPVLPLKAGFFDIEGSVMLNFFFKGGPVMYPLLFCSVISLSIIFERALFWLRLSRNRDSVLVGHILELAEKEDYTSALELGKQSKDYIVRMLMGGIAHRRYSLPSALEMGAEEEIKRTSKYLNILDTIITVAPLLGIFGTVIGIINSFDLLGRAGIEHPQVVTGGIAQALITTATGLGVAMMTLLPYNYFLSKIQSASKELEKFGTSLEITFERQNAKFRQ
jgi:biopolymer transport protein ExbB